jgi:hypothetical protein
MYTTCGLAWVEADEPMCGFKPMKLRSARTPLGVYELFQSADGFDAWFTRRDGVLTFLGTSRTATGARERCEAREARRAKKEPVAHGYRPS